MRIAGSSLRVLGVLRGERLAAGAALAVGVSLLASGGCGYTLAGHGSFLPTHIHTIGIPTFTNRTTVFNIETMLTEKVRSEFIGRGKYTILPQSTGVDALVVGEVSAISLTPVSFSPGQIASRYTLNLVAKIDFRDLIDDKTIWNNPALSFREDYEATGGTAATDPAAFFNQQSNALDRVSTDFARTIVSSILEAF